jgi:hypothetical protein
MECPEPCAFKSHTERGMDEGTSRTDFGLSARYFDELDIADDEYGDVYVKDEFEWCVSVNKGRYAILENLEKNEPVCMAPLDRPLLLELMKAVAEGRSRELLDKHPWTPGYPRGGPADRRTRPGLVSRRSGRPAPEDPRATGGPDRG